MESKYTTEQLLAAVEKSNNAYDCAKILGASHKSMYKVLMKAILLNNINVEHWYQKKSKRTMDFNDYLVENSSYRGSSSSMRKKLISLGLLINKCTLCELEPFWAGKELVLQLDHINGNNSDNRKSKNSSS